MGDGAEARGRRSGEGHLPSLCVGAQFTRADDQHSGRVHPVQSHLRVQAEARHDVLQVSPGLLPPLEERTGQENPSEAPEAGGNSSV